METIGIIAGIVLAVSIVEELLVGALFAWGVSKWRSRKSRRFAY